MTSSRRTIACSCPLGALGQRGLKAQLLVDSVKLVAVLGLQRGRHVLEDGIEVHADCADGALEEVREREPQAPLDFGLDLDPHLSAAGCSVRRENGEESVDVLLWKLMARQDREPAKPDVLLDPAGQEVIAHEAVQDCFLVLASEPGVPVLDPRATLGRPREALVVLCKVAPATERKLIERHRLEGIGRFLGEIAKRGAMYLATTCTIQCSMLVPVSEGAARTAVRSPDLFSHIAESASKAGSVLRADMNRA